jgi:hypothetical protein
MTGVVPSFWQHCCRYLALQATLLIIAAEVVVRCIARAVST